MTDPGDQNVHPPKPLCTDTLDLFAPSPVDPPTGPKADPYTQSDGRPEAFLDFMESPDGKMVWQHIMDAALQALANGEKRFSVLGEVHVARAITKAKVNNTFAPWIADALVAHEPALLAIVERRVRKKAAP